MVWIGVFLWRGQNCRILEQVGKFHQDHLEDPIKNQLGHRCCVLPALKVLQVLASYWSLLMLPRVLPPDLKAPDDQYVKDTWRRKWKPIPVYLSGECQGQRSLAGYSPWGHRVGHHQVTKTHTHTHDGAFPVAQWLKKSACNAEASSDYGWIPGSGSSLGGGDGNPL